MRLSNSFRDVSFVVAAPYFAIYICVDTALIESPILIFSGLYFYFMWGYVGRISLTSDTSFPGFVSLSGPGDLWLLLKKHRAAAISNNCQRTFALPSIAFDAHMLGDAPKDSRSALRGFAEAVGTRSVTVGVFSGLGGYFHGDASR
jgi:hypothetical protein